MKSTKHLEAVSKKLASAPDLPYKKGSLNSPRSPKPKEKDDAKTSHGRIEPMVLRSPPTGESMIRFALPIPLNKTKKLISEGEILKKITRHLKKAVSNLEDAYGLCTEDKKVTAKAKEEGVSLSLGDDIKTFLGCCSEFATQMEEALKEESNILESLFKWFQQQVNQMEEISKEQPALEEPPDKHLSFVQVVTLMQKFEDLRKHLTVGPKNFPLFKPTDQETLATQCIEDLEKKIEEFIKSHSTEDSESVPEPETAETPPSVSSRLDVMIKIFENQANMLERALNEQSVLEEKYKQMQSDFELLTEEKSTLENEVQKLKEPEKKPTIKDNRKKLVKIEKKKDKGKPEDSQGKTSVSVERKTTEQFLQIQKEASDLRMEKKILQDQLKLALQEAERNKNQLEYILNQRMEQLKNEHMSGTKVEMFYSKTKLTGEGSKSALMERRSRTTVLLQPSEPRIDEIYTYFTEVPDGHKERSVNESSSKKKTSTGSESSFYITIDRDVPVPVPSSMPSTPPPEAEKSVTTVSPSNENQDLPSEAQERQTVVSFALPEESSKVDAEEIAETGSESQPYSESTEDYSDESEESDESDDKTPPPEEETLSESHMLRSSSSARLERRKAIFITAKSPDDKTKSEMDNLDATSYEYVHLEDKEADKKPEPEPAPAPAPAPEQQDSKTGMTTKRIKSKTEKLTIQFEGVDADQKVKQETLKKVKSQIKKHTSKSRKASAPNPEEDVKFIVKLQESMPKIEKLAKKQKIPKRERPTDSDEVKYKSLDHDREESVLKVKAQAKTAKRFREDHDSDEVKHKSLDPEREDSVLKVGAQAKRAKGIREDHDSDEVKHKSLDPEREDSVLKVGAQAKRAKGIREDHDSDEVKHKSLDPEREDSVLKVGAQAKRAKGIREDHDSDEVKHKSLDPEREDSVLKVGAQAKRANGIREDHDSDEVKHKSLDPEREDSVLKVGAQAKTAKRFREDHDSDEVKHKSLDPEREDSVLKVGAQAKTAKRFREDHDSDEVKHKSLDPDREDSVLKVGAQEKTAKRFRADHELPFESWEKDLSPENLLYEETFASTGSQSQVEVLEDDENESFYYQDMEPMTDVSLLSKGSTSRLQPSQIKKRKVASKKRHDNNVDGTFTLEELDSISKNELEISRVGPSQESKCEHEAAAEVLDISEDFVPLNPSISDIILKLGLDTVVETELDTLKNAFGKHLLRSDISTLSKTALEKSQQLADRTERSRTELEEKSFHEADSEHWIRPPGGDIKKGLANIGYVGQKDSNIEFKSIVKGIKILGQEKTLLKGSSNTKTSGGIYTKYHPVNAFPTKVVNLSPFDIPDEYENVSPRMSMFSKPLYRTSRGSSVVSPSIQLPGLTEQILGKSILRHEKDEFLNNLSFPASSTTKHVLKGHSKSKIVNNKGVENKAHFETSSGKKPAYKGQVKLINLTENGLEFPDELHTATSLPKKQAHRGLPKLINVGEKGVELPNNLRTISTLASSTKKRPHKGDSKHKLREKIYQIQDNRRFSSYPTRESLLKGLPSILNKLLEKDVKLSDRHHAATSKTKQAHKGSR